ncbi:nucleotidyltransferase family protein [Ectobacillus funiculus]|uniref:nucleotidyltransferase domain-containing protein n=1 Tax=Ectobacillus funiculus TaxID=137993 RepID=UPI00397DD6E6
MVVTLIQALYDSRTPLPEDVKFYKQALEDIEFFAIYSQIYHLLKQQGRLEQTPPFFQEQLKQKYNESLYLNMFIRNQTEQILKAFEDAGINVIPLKGVTFAEKYFGHIGARGTSDIDLLIKASDLETAVNCVKALGYTVEEEYIPSHFHCSFSKELPGSSIPLTVELHWGLLKENTSNLQIDEFWSQAKPVKSYSYIKELSDYHTFYMICLHGWKHNLNSLKYFIDIMQMIYVLGNKLDYTLLVKDAASHKTLRRIVRTLSIVYNLFPQLEKVKKFPFKKSTNLWWQYEVIRGMNVKTFRQYVNFTYFNFLDFDTVKHSLIAIYSWVLPSKVELSFELELEKDRSIFTEYLKLYRKRGYNFLKNLLRR